MTSKWKNIVVSESNYLALKRLGGTGDSFNDVLSNILQKISQLEKRKILATNGRSVTATQIGLQEGSIYERETLIES
jgi:predicted CopG family antitoxin